MIVLGIDPGVARTGWAILVKTTSLKLLTYGCLETEKSLPQEKRLALIFEGLQKIIGQYRPEVVCLEKLFFNTNAKTVMAVGEARGVMKLCIVQAGLPLFEFTPLQIKTCITGYGRAEKIQIQKMVKTLLSLKEIPRPDDAADAVAAALTYCLYNQKLLG